MLEQETNAYAVLPDSQWRGYRPPQEPPAPAPGTWGEPTPMPSVLAQAAAETGDLRAVVGILASDPKDRLAACAGEPRAGLHGARLVSFTGLHEMQRNIPQLQISEAQHRLTVPTATDEGRKAALNGSGGPVGAS